MLEKEPFFLGTFRIDKLGGLIPSRKYPFPKENLK